MPPRSRRDQAAGSLMQEPLTGRESGSGERLGSGMPNWQGLAEAARRPAERTYLPNDGLELRDDDFSAIAQLAESHFGLHLAPGKEMLVIARLRAPLLRLGLQSIPEYLRMVQQDGNGDLMSEFVEVLTTNHTHFFRESSHFDYLVQEVCGPTSAPPRVWTAACATGEEAYSLGIVMRERWGDRMNSEGYLLASDISRRALQTAVRGIYQEARLATMPAGLVAKYFLKGEGQWDGSYRMKRELFPFIHYQLINLIEPLPETGMFDAIFCRNVMIYFTQETRNVVLEHLKSRLKPGGHLFVGHSESLGTADEELRFCKPAVYQYLGPRNR